MTTPREKSGFPLLDHAPLKWWQFLLTPGAQRSAKRLFQKDRKPEPETEETLQRRYFAEHPVARPQIATGVGPPPEEFRPQPGRSFLDRLAIAEQQRMEMDEIGAATMLAGMKGLTQAPPADASLLSAIIYTPGIGYPVGGGVSVLKAARAAWSVRPGFGAATGIVESAAKSYVTAAARGPAAQAVVPVRQATTVPRVKLTAQTLPLRVTKFLKPELETARKSTETHLSNLGIEMDALAGISPDEWFVVIQRPKDISKFMESVASLPPKVKKVVADWAVSGINPATGKKWDTFTEGNLLGFKDFDDVERFLTTGEYQQPQFRFSSRSDAPKLYESAQFKAKQPMTLGKGPERATVETGFTDYAGARSTTDLAKAEQAALTRWREAKALETSSQQARRQALAAGQAELPVAGEDIAARIIREMATPEGKQAHRLAGITSALEDMANSDLLAFARRHARKLQQPDQADVLEVVRAELESRGLTGRLALPAPSVAKVPSTAVPARGRATVAAKEPWQMTRAEFDQAVLYRGVSKSNASLRNTYWANRLSAAEMYGAAMEEPRLRIALKRDVPSDLLGPGGVDATIAEGEHMGALGMYIPEGYDLPVKAEMPVGVDPHRYIVKQALSEGKPVPPEVLAQYPDLAPSVAPAPKAAKAAEVTEPVNDTLQKIHDMRQRLFRELGERQGLSGDPFSQAVSERVVAELGSDPVIRLYRGVNKDVQGLPGRFWTPFHDEATSYAKARGGSGTLHAIDVKASELANAELTGAVHGTIGEWRLPDELQGRAFVLTPSAAGQLPPSGIAAPTRAGPLVPEQAAPGAPAAPIEAPPYKEGPFGPVEPPIKPPVTTGGVSQPVPEPTVGATILGFRPVQYGLSKRQRAYNLFKRTVGKPWQAIEDDAIATPIMAEAQRLRDVSVSQANVVGAQNAARLRRVFKFDKQDRIPDLAGVDGSISGAPTIQDVAARYDRYEASLTAAQKEVMLALRDDMARYNTTLRTVFTEASAIKRARAGLRGVAEDVMPFGTRPDITEGGFYVSRGPAALEGADIPVRLRSGMKGVKQGFELPSALPSMAEGLNAGYEYGTLEEILTGYARNAGVRAIDQHVATAFLGLRDAKGSFLGETAKMRMFRLNPDLTQRMEGLRANVSRLRSLAGKFTSKQDDVITRFLDGDEFDDLDAFQAVLREVKVSKGKSAGATPQQLRQAMADTLREIRALRPEYKKALEKAKQLPRDQAVLGMPQLTGVSFPTALANAANKVLLSQSGQVGGLTIARDTVQEINSMYMMVNLTLDNSAPGIQGLLAFYRKPRAAVSALRMSYLAWADSNVLGKFYPAFDQLAVREGRLPVREWVKAGLRQGGLETEFTVQKGVTGFLGRLPGARQANRAFANFGDALRLKWADDMLRDELHRGRSLENIVASGDVYRMAEIADNMTGYSRTRAGGSVGELLLLAPRYFQSRLNTLSKAALGLRPGAPLDQRLARRSVLQMVAAGTMLTVGLNELLGQKTDFRPLIRRNGKLVRNYNFMRVRFAGRDWSLFGAWDSMVGMIILVGTGEAASAFRAVSSGSVSMLWDLLSGEDFTHRKTREDREAFVRWATEQFMPLALEQAVPTARQVVVNVQEGEIGPAVGGVVTMVAEVHGAKSSPLSYGDMRDIIAIERFGKRYSDLNRGQRNVVKDDRRLGELAAALPTDRGTPEQQMAVLFDTWGLAKANLEAGLRVRIDAGRTGDALRRTISEFKRDRFTTSETLFNNQVFQVSSEDAIQPVEDVLAELYWNVPLKEDLMSGELDFASRDAVRNGVLLDADRYGVDRKYITGADPGSFRGKRFADPVIRVTVLEYETAMEALRPYWEITRKTLEADPAGRKMWAIWKEYQSLPAGAERDNYGKEQERVINFVRRAERALRLRMRQQDALIDSLLVQWYGSAPQHPANKVRRLQERADLAGVR